jgi:hypothetical protein
MIKKNNKILIFSLMVALFSNIFIFSSARAYSITPVYLPSPPIPGTKCPLGQHLCPTGECTPHTRPCFIYPYIR